MRRIVAISVSAGALMVAGCGPQSILNTHSKQTHDIAVLWWWMLAAATIVFLGAVALLAIAWLRRGSPGLPVFGDREPIAQGMVVVFGIAVPIVALVALFGISDVYLVGETSPPNPRTTAMTIDVVGHRWWWEVRYGGGKAVTANEIHIPVDTRVNLVATTADVIHSFWVPALNRKIDMVPGIQNRILLDASRPGDYRGQCSQFCGVQHAHMGLYVIAQRPTRFRAWLAAQEQPAVNSTSTQAQAGKRLFMSDQCASCHTIAGTAAQGDIGPNLTHLASRGTLAGAEIPNRPAWLAAWIRNPQAIKPGDRMPDLGLHQNDISDLVAYLDTLK
jgi:cytochrome c oxidase subunit 2